MKTGLLPGQRFADLSVKGNAAGVGLAVEVVLIIAGGEDIILRDVDLDVAVGVLAVGAHDAAAVIGDELPPCRNVFRFFLFEDTPAARAA